MPPSNDRFAAGAAASGHSEDTSFHPRGAGSRAPVPGATAAMRDHPDSAPATTAAASVRAGARATELRSGEGGGAAAAAGMGLELDHDGVAVGDEAGGAGSGGTAGDRKTSRPHGATSTPSRPRHPPQQQHPAAVTARDPSHDAFPVCPPPGSGASPTGEAGAEGMPAGCNGDSGGDVSVRDADGDAVSAAVEAVAEMEMVPVGEETDPGTSAGLPPPSLSWSTGSHRSSVSRRGQRLPQASAGVEVEGNAAATAAGMTAAAAAAAAAGAAMVSPEVVGGRMRPDLLDTRSDGSSGGSSRDYGGMIGPASPFSQALHIALAFVVLVLVAFAKADTPYDEGAGYGGSSSSGSGTPRNPGSTPSRRRRSRQGSNAGGSGQGVTQRNSGIAPAKRRRLSSGKSGGGSRDGSNTAIGDGGVFPWSPTAFRHLRAAWSKLWHLVEDDLAGRWRTAGRALASLRQAWSALWVLPPHPEADVLAEALASPPRYSRGTTGRHPGPADAGGGGGSGGVGGVGGSGGGGSERRRRSFGRAGSGRRSGKRVGAADGGPGDNVGRPVGLNCLNFLSLCGYRPGGGGGSRRSKFLLLLDLDETLVHCSPHLMQPARRRSGGGGGGGGGNGGRLRPDLKLEMRGRAPSDNRPSCMYAWKRPHLDVFLDVVSRWYEVAVFTSGRQSFAEPLIDLIDSRCVIGKRFFRDSCVRRDAAQSTATAAGAAAAATAAAPAGSSESVKDLRVVGSEHFPLRTVLVDNQPRTVVQQANVLPVKSWFPRDSEDRQLLDLLPVLLALTACQDVRSVLSLRPGVGGGGRGDSGAPAPARLG
ncbi:unnamed protein product [Scytosiphon promiscuus]